MLEELEAGEQTGAPETLFSVMAPAGDTVKVTEAPRTGTPDASVNCK
jgi:hypothetical protein